jgi:hypothetical protein
MRAARTTTAPTTLSSRWPAAAAIPSAALVHSAAAVVTPRTDPPSRRIAPAPMKPMPETTCAATRSGSVFAPDGTPTNP